MGTNNLTRGASVYYLVRTRETPDDITPPIYAIARKIDDKHSEVNSFGLALKILRVDANRIFQVARPIAAGEVRRMLQAVQESDDAFRTLLRQLVIASEAERV